jgi:hypothetical protein
LERLFTANLQQIRVHDDSQARASASALDAAAVTRGEDIFLGTHATGDLLAHEVSHVLQQRGAASIDVNRVGEAGDRFEQTAERASHADGIGQHASVATGGSVPGVQRQRAAERATRSEAQTALTAFLNRALGAQGGRALRVTQQVRDAVMHLFRNEPMASASVEAWMNGVALPGDPAEFAAQVARRLPASVDRTLVDDLSRMPAGPEPAGRAGRVRELVEKSAPGEPERPPEPSQPSSQERFERTVGDIRRSQGQQPPTTYGPYSVDVLRLGRVAQGLPQAWRGPKTPAAPGPEASSYPEVETAIEQIAADALVPAAARGKPEAGDYAEAREVARDLARKLDIAQQQKQSAVDLRLPAAYSTAADRAAIEQQLERIVALVRDALPHHATNVRQVNVFYGERIGRWISVSPNAR